MHALSNCFYVCDWVWVQFLLSCPPWTRPLLLFSPKYAYNTYYVFNAFYALEYVCMYVNRRPNSFRCVSPVWGPDSTWNADMYQYSKSVCMRNDYALKSAQSSPLQPDIHRSGTRSLYVQIIVAAHQHVDIETYGLLHVTCGCDHDLEHGTVTEPYYNTTRAKPRNRYQ